MDEINNSDSIIGIKILSTFKNSFNYVHYYL